MSAQNKHARRAPGATSRRQQAKKQPGRFSWADVTNRLMSLKPKSRVRIDKSEIPPPKSVPRFRRSTGFHQKGTQTHWRATLPDGRCLHVLERRGDYEAHLDLVDPAVDLLGHLAQDAPAFFMISSLATGLLVGAGVTYVATGRAEETSGGALLGGLLATLFAGGSLSPDQVPAKLMGAVEQVRSRMNKGERQGRQEATRG